MNKIKTYLQESYIELMQKVTWPTRKELTSSAIIVMVSSLIFAIVVFIMDFSFKHIVTFIYKLFI